MTFIILPLLREAWILYYDYWCMVYLWVCIDSVQQKTPLLMAFFVVIGIFLLFIIGYSLVFN